MVTLFCFSSVFFSEMHRLLFSFSHSFNNIVKTKCKTPFSKSLKGYDYYIFLISGIQKLRGHQNIYFQKNKGLHRIWRPS